MFISILFSLNIDLIFFLVLKDIPKHFHSLPFRLDSTFYGFALFNQYSAWLIMAVFHFPLPVFRLQPPNWAYCNGHLPQLQLGSFHQNIYPPPTTALPNFSVFPIFYLYPAWTHYFVICIWLWEAKKKCVFHFEARRGCGFLFFFCSIFFCCLSCYCSAGLSALFLVPRRLGRCFPLAALPQPQKRQKFKSQIQSQGSFSEQRCPWAKSKLRRLSSFFFLPFWPVKFRTNRVNFSAPKHEKKHKFSFSFCMQPLKLPGRAATLTS